MADISEPSPGPSSSQNIRPGKRKAEFVLPSISCISSNLQESSLPLWEQFGVHLNPDLTIKSTGKRIREFIGLLDQAVQCCRFPSRVPRTSAMGMGMTAIMASVEKKSNTRNTWFHMTGEERLEIRRLINKTNDGTFNNTQQKAWDVVEAIASRLHQLSDPSAGRMRKEPEGDNALAESDYEFLVSGILERFFSVRKMEAQSTLLHTNSRHLQCSGEIKLDPMSYFRGLMSLVVEVKGRAVRDSSVKNATLQSCHGTINQHFNQLLFSIRDSVFSRDWSLFKQSKMPESEMYTVFGMMVHGTEFQLTCLQVSAEHLRKINRPPKVRFSSKSMLNAESGDVEDGPGTREKVAKGQEDSSSEVGSTSSSPLRESKHDAIFHVCKPVDISKIFLFHDDFLDFMEMVEFLEALSNIANFEQKTKMKMNKKIKTTV